LAEAVPVRAVLSVRVAELVAQSATGKIEA
jgi:hypothetical protein